jgi:hypothetical protein
MEARSFIGQGMVIKDIAVRGTQSEYLKGTTR